MRPTISISLMLDDKTNLQGFVHRGKANARTVTRAHILLKCDEGWSNTRIREAYGTSDQTIRNVRERFLAGGVEAVLTDKRQEKRRQALTDEQGAHIIAIACSDVPAGHDHWTIRMLAGKAIELGFVENISPETIRRMLKKAC